MDTYDVIVVGAGPGGASAAMAASKKGAKTILLEEHPVIGYPRHCTGRLHGTSFSKEILGRVDKHVVITEVRARRYFSPNGKLILDSPIPPGTVYLIVREELDRALARQAVEAGAQIALNTRVVGVLRENGKIRGVTTGSNSRPLIHGRIVIVAQGSKGRKSGISRQEGLSYPDETFESGVMVELTGVRDIERAVFDTFFGAMTPRGFMNLWPHGDRTCFMTGSKSLKALQSLAQRDYPVSQRIKAAVPIQIQAHLSGSKGGVMLPSLVKDGLMLIGDSAGFNGITHAIVSGRCAGETAAEALQEGDVSEARLRKYENRCRQIGLHRTIGSWDKLLNLQNLSDEAIEAVLPEMLTKNQVEYRDLLPI